MSKGQGRTYCVCRNTSGPYSFASPKHTPLIAARDIKVATKPAAAFDSSDRTVNVETVVPVRRNIEVSFSSFWNAGVGLTALRDAFVNGTAIDLAVIDKAPAISGKGFRGDWCVSKFPMKFPLAGGQMIDITLKPHANYTNRVRIFTDAASGTLGTAETQASKKIGFGASVNDSTDTPIPTARDIEWSLEWKEEEASDRAQEADGLGVAFEQYLPCQRVIKASFEVIWNESVHSAFRTAYESNDPIELTFLDGPFATPGSWGIHTDWAITDWPIDAPLNDGQKVKLSFSPHGDGSNDFEFVTIS